MTWSKKPSSNLVNSVQISVSAFQYILDQRHANKEPFYKVLDRIILEHKRLVEKEI